MTQKNKEILTVLHQWVTVTVLPILMGVVTWCVIEMYGDWKLWREIIDKKIEAQQLEQKQLFTQQQLRDQSQDFKIERLFEITSKN